MNSEPITLTVVDGEETYELTTFAGEYRSLMMLLYDRIYLEDFGECLGMGRCGTCAIVVDATTKPLTSFDRNERITLEKEGIFDPNVHLACQIVIDAGLKGAVIRVYHPKIQ